ncbi:MAG: AMP-binding protein [Streptosporangiales bacterium]|nr:AMP-binding protein [Streptosporangiales bacterium]
MTAEPTTAATSLTALLAERAAATPDAIAVIETAAIEGARSEGAGSERAGSERAGSEDVGSRRLSYAGLRATSEALAARLHSEGVRAGDCVAVWLPNWLDALVWQFAVARLGASVLGVNTRYNVHELVHLVTVARPVCVALPDDFHGIDFRGRLREALDTAKPETTALVAVVAQNRAPDPAGFDLGGGAFVHRTADGLGTPGTGATAPTGAPASAGTPAAAAPPPPLPDPAAIVNYFTTSGSTGNPKLAGHDQAAVTRHAAAGAAAFGMTETTPVMLCVLPLLGVFGFNAVMATLHAGGTCLFTPVFDPARTVADMVTYGVTHTIGGDDLHGRLMDSWREDPRPLRAWRQAGIADFAGRSPAIADWAQTEFGVPVRGVYGSSEVFALTAVRGPDLSPADRVRGGGRPVDAGIEVRACDPVSGAVLAPGEQGELQFRGYNVLPGYLRNPEANAAVFTEDGWFRSGDLGSVDDPGTGTFTYVCRMGDALRLHGFLTEPAEIENYLAAHPQVATAKVVAADRGDGMGVAVAFVVPADPGRPPGEDELIAYCRSGLARYKVPSRVVPLDAFPTTAGTNGTKIRTAELRRRATELLTDA